MKVFESAWSLMLGSSLLTFTTMCFAVSQRAPTLSNPGLFVEAVGFAGAVFVFLGARGLYRLHKALSSGQPTATSRAAA